MERSKWRGTNDTIRASVMYHHHNHNNDSNSEESHETYNPEDDKDHRSPESDR